VHSITRHSRTVLRYAKESLNLSEFMALKTAYEAEQQMTVRVRNLSTSMRHRVAGFTG
jgi:hypothetical protein